MLMFGLDVWDFVLLVAAAYVAVSALVRLMQQRRESVIDDLTREVEQEKQRLKQSRKRERRRKMREELAEQRRQRRDAA